MKKNRSHVKLFPVLMTHPLPYDPNPFTQPSCYSLITYNPSNTFTHASHMLKYLDQISNRISKLRKEA